MPTITRFTPGLFACAALILSFFFPIASAGADSSSPVLSRVVKTRVLRIGMSGNQPPLNFLSKGGEMMGLEVDMARLLAVSIGVEAEIVQKPFGELLAALEKGEVDLVMSGMTITLERNLKAAFIGPYFLSGKSILTKSKTLAQADEAEDLDDAKVTLVALTGSTSQRFVERAVPQAKLVTTDTYDQAVKLVMEDEADAMVADREICNLTMMRNPQAGLATLVNPFTIEPIGIAVRADDPLLLNLIQNYLNAFNASGGLERLTARWFQDGSWIAELP